MMGRSRQDILNKKETEKMCLSDGNELDEMCSVEDNDTCGDCMPSVKKSPINQRISSFWRENRCVFLFL